MSQKIITKIFNYANTEGAEHLVIHKHDNRLVLDCFCPGTDKQSLILPKRLEKEFLSSLRKITSIAPDELVSQKYCKLPHKNGCRYFYLTILPEAGSEKVIINFVKKSPTLWRLSQLGLQRADLQTLKKSLARKSGLVLISSPEGSGKSATLNALLLEMGDSSRSAYALMKYRAYDIPGITTMGSNPRNWDKIMKIDSQVIYSDDLDNAESLKEACQAAASGRLVFGAISAENCLVAIEKIMACPLPLKLKLDNLKIITNQRLAVLKRSKRLKNQHQRKTIGLFEVLKVSPAVREFLINHEGQNLKMHQEELAKLILQDGFVPLASDRQQKTRDGLI